MDAPEKRRWYRPTPGWLVYGSLVATGLIWLSNWLEWPAWHKGYAVLAAVAGVGVALLVMLLWWLAAMVFGWRFQFSLRSLVALTLAVAVPCSWLALEIEQGKRQREALGAVEQLNGHGGYSSTPDWLHKVLGDDFAFSVNVVNLKGGLVTDARLENLKGLNELQVLFLVDTEVTDNGLWKLRGLTKLRFLWLDGTKLTDAGLEHLAVLTRLEEVHVCNTRVTDEGVGRLQQALPNCKIIR